MVVFVVATLLSVFLVSLIAFIGLFFLGFKAEKLKTVLIYLVSFSAGVLFGDAFLHLLPEAAEGGFSIIVSAGVLSGIGCFFVLEKVIHWQHCHLPITKQHVHPFAYTNVVGDGLHNLIDGMIIAASYMASVPVGVATTLAVLLHEIPQEIGDFGVLLHGGFSKGKALFVNFLSALTAFIGAGIVLVFGNGLGVFLVPFAAGSFIYIAGSDLIPELHKETRLPRSLLQVGLFALGIGVMVALLFLE
ncbi:MAG TPA: ZIP family metal transporter [Candidatus Nanoarchaeia archaeon]|nr:ZIP family metal transporter [Candidatus Nanoarchaeia archaeon]